MMRWGGLSANHRHEVMPPQVIVLYPKESGPKKRGWPYILKLRECPNASVLKRVRPMEVWHCRYDTKHPVYDQLMHLREASHHQGLRTGGLEWLPLKIKKPMVRALPHFVLPDPPSWMGRLACIHAMSLRSQLVIAEMPDLSSESNSTSNGWPVHFQPRYSQCWGLSEKFNPPIPFLPSSWVPPETFLNNHLSSYIATT